MGPALLHNQDVLNLGRRQDPVSLSAQPVVLLRLTPQAGFDTARQSLTLWQ